MISSDFLLEKSLVLHPRVPNNNNSETFDDVLQKKISVCASVYWNYSAEQKGLTAGHAMPMVGIDNGKYIFKNSFGVEGIEEGIDKNRIIYSEVIKQNKPPSVIDPNFIDIDSDADFGETATRFVYDNGYSMKFGN